MKLKWNGVEWGRNDLKSKYRNTHHEPYYIYWFDFAEVPEYRKWGSDHFWYNGPHKWYCFWYFNVGWSTPWTHWVEK